MKIEITYLDGKKIKMNASIEVINGLRQRLKSTGDWSTMKFYVNDRGTDIFVRMDQVRQVIFFEGYNSNIAE